MRIKNKKYIKPIRKQNFLNFYNKLIYSCTKFQNIFYFAIILSISYKSYLMHLDILSTKASFELLQKEFISVIKTNAELIREFKLQQDEFKELIEKLSKKLENSEKELNELKNTSKSFFYSNFPTNNSTGLGSNASQDMPFHDNNYTQTKYYFYNSLITLGKLLGIVLITQHLLKQVNPFIPDFYNINYFKNSFKYFLDTIDYIANPFHKSYNYFYDTGDLRLKAKLGTNGDFKSLEFRDKSDISSTYKGIELLLEASNHFAVKPIYQLPSLDGSPRLPIQDTLPEDLPTSTEATKELIRGGSYSVRRNLDLDSLYNDNQY